MRRLTEARVQAMRMINDGMSDATLARRLGRNPVAHRDFLQRMINAGLVARRTIVSGQIDWLSLTDAGRAALAQQEKAGADG